MSLVVEPTSERLADKTLVFPPPTKKLARPTVKNAFFTLANAHAREREPIMAKRPLKVEEIAKLLTAGEAGSLATTGPDGPYVVPVNYLYWKGKIYFHGPKDGRKMANIALDPRVSFLVYETQGYRRGPTPCATSTLYQSVVVRGRARIVEGQTAFEALTRLGAKFSPDTIGEVIPADKLAITTVVEIEIERLTGKAGE
jgi:nitroimidazol reductase NimA-like FMN-containing flavoprotein (pyridoxamine 5'-phosphate oxidase superfamily)